MSAGPQAPATVQTILEFVELAVARRLRTFNAGQRARLELLETALREGIDGARLAPRKIEGRAVEETAKVSSTVAPPAAAVTITKSKPTNLGSLSEELTIAPKDKDKLNDVQACDIHASSYTPSQSPLFLADWYDEGLSPAATINAGEKVKSVVRAGETGEMELTRDVRVLLGLSAAVPPAEAKSVAPIEGTRRPIIIHLLAGGTRRGQLERFDPDESAISFFDEAGAAASIDTDQVLALFFGLRRGEEPKATHGRRISVQLINDRQVAGLTDDYREDAPSLTVTPEQRRGNVERIWLPRSAIKTIRLLD